MNSHFDSPLPFWRTVRLLLSITGKRAEGRRKRQQELLHTRTRGKGMDWGCLGFALTILMMFFINGSAAFVLRLAVEAGERIETERRGKIIVSQYFVDAIRKTETEAGGPGKISDEVLYPVNYYYEANKIFERDGGNEKAIELRLRKAVREHGSQDLISKGESAPGFAAFPGAGAFPAMLGSIVLIWWGMMLVFQGEGLELDLQRRRHPMWEWLFSHPVSPGAIFLAEMLSPIAANPVYWAAPLFVGFLYGFIHDLQLGMLATFLIGIPLAIAAACVGKALEIAVILRFPPRTRGAMIGLMGWLGYASMMLLFLGIFVLEKIFVIWKFLAPLTVLPWPWLNLFVGVRSDGSFSFLSGMLTCWLAAGVAIAGAVWFSAWGAKQGLSGNLGRADTKPSASKRRRTAGFGRGPLYRKEFLWFVRDRSAIVQTILIPITIASFQLFNLRTLLAHAQGAWNYLCGTGILFGTYFLWILGPKSFSSEGTALWIALTWPRGLESLLKAKAWLWSLIATGIVVLVLGYAAFLFPVNSWQILLVGIGWWFFGRSMAEKT